MGIGLYGVYDGTSNVTSVVSSNTNGLNIGYGYDTLNRLSTVTDNNLGATQTAYTYDDVSKLATVTYPNGVVHTYGYDPKNQLTSLAVNRGATALANYGYTYGFAGQKLTANELNGRATTFGYDIVYKLLNETIASDPTPSNNGAIGYAHDAVGNRLTRTSTVTAITPSSAIAMAGCRVGRTSRPKYRARSVACFLFIDPTKRGTARMRGRLAAQIPSAMKKLPRNLKRNEGLAGTRRECEQDALFPRSDSFQHPLDGDVLIVSWQEEAAFVLEGDSGEAVPPGVLSASNTNLIPQNIVPTVKLAVAQR